MIAFAVVVTVIGLVGAGSINLGGSATTTTAPVPVDPLAKYLATENSALAGALHALDVTVPSRPGSAAPTWPPKAWRVPTGSHQVVGFVPWYELTAASSAGSAPPTDFTQLVYHSLAVNRDGSLAETAGPNNGGYDEIANGGASSLIARGHEAGARVLLGLSSSTQSTIDALCAKPVSAGHKMASQAGALLARYGFDGVNLDLEGQGAADRAGFVRFVRSFATSLGALDPKWSVMLNTYPNSAVDTTSFFDVKALAPSVTNLFVMAYDMSDLQVPSATAPLWGVDLSDASTLATYAAAGLASKVILGIPFYGYDFTASQSKPGAATIGSPYSVTYAAVVHAGRRAVWDPTTDTPYTPFRRAGQWHQTWFDDPVSVALKTALAAQFHTAGVGAWELGMASGQPDMVQALLGGSPPLKLPLAH